MSTSTDISTSIRSAAGAASGGTRPVENHGQTEGYVPRGDKEKEKKARAGRRRDNHHARHAGGHAAPAVLVEGEAWEAARKNDARWLWEAVGLGTAGPEASTLWQLAALRDDAGDSVLHAACLHGANGEGGG